MAYTGSDSFKADSRGADVGPSLKREFNEDLDNGDRERIKSSVTDRASV